jgi:electron transport complex protein RnfG
MSTPPTNDDDAARTAGPGLRQPASITLAGLLILWLASEMTREPIARNESDQLMKVIATVLVPGSYDNEPHRDRIYVRSPELLGRDEPLPLYRARKSGQPVAAVITAVTSHGYIGPVHMLVAIAADGRVEGVRVLAHEETPGLGDRVEDPAWLRQFAGRTPGDPDTAGWAVRRDGGRFDAISGATISSRAVIHAVRDAALFFERHREEIFGRPSEQQAPAATGIGTR